MKMIRRLEIPALLAVIVVMASCGLKEIPLFNPEARAINRVVSAREFYTEVANQVSDARDKGWLTQAQIDSSIVPSMNTAMLLINEAEAFVTAGDTGNANNRLNAAKSLLTALRNQMSKLERSRS